MPALSVLKNNFSAGELSGLMLARNDFERYTTGAKNLENWLVLLQGGLRTRFGTRFVVCAKYGNRLCRVMPFEASGTEAYILEVGHEYVRFCTPGAQILTDAATPVPVEVGTTYQEEELRALRTAQLNDIMFIVHGKHPPAQLSRTSDDTWTYKPIVFDPPPLYEAGYEPNATLTPSALTGTITLTASAPVFLATDNDRVIQARDARVAITEVVSATVVTGDVLSAFTTLAPIAAGDWKLERSPVGELQPSKQQPVGAQVRLDLRLKNTGAASLIINGGFGSALGTGWVNLSGPTITTGTHTGGSNSLDTLIDSAQDFFNVGVRPGHSVVNITDGNSRGTVLFLRDAITLNLDGEGLGGGPDSDFDTGDAYEIIGSGGAVVRDGKCFLTGNALGIGWIEQEVATVIDQAYRVQFDVSEGAISAQVGSATTLSDLKEELSYDQGNNLSLVFVATSATSYVQFRNNQPNSGAVDNVTVKLYSAEGWRESDIGKYVKVHDGLVKITHYVNGTRVRGTILRELLGGDAGTVEETTPPPVAAPGSWRLLEHAWSNALGWPSFLTFFEGRLYFTGVEHFPQTEWGSHVNDFYNFFEGPNADDAVRFQIVDSSGNVTLNQIKWLAPGENLLAGTTHGEYRQTGPADGAFSATELPLIRLQSTFGNADVQPIRVGQSLFFVQRQGSKIRQMSFEADVAASFLAKDVTILSGHFLKSHRALELAYQPEALPLVWVVRSDGQLLTLTFDLVEQVVGWAHHVTDGLFESVAPIPHPTANSYQVWTVVQRTQSNGNVIRCLEYFDDQAEMSGRVAIDGVVPSWQGLTLDSARLYTFGTAQTALTGLEHLAGGPITVIGDGILYDNIIVSDMGEAMLPVPCFRVWAGLPYTCTAETLPLETMLRTGTTHGHERNWLKLVAQVHETIGLRVNGQRMPTRTPGMPLSAAVALFTGKIPIVMPSEWSMDSTITLVQDQPFPATVLAVAGDLDFGGLG